MANQTKSPGNEKPNFWIRSGLISGALAGTVMAALIGVGQSYLEGQHKFQTDLVMKMLEHDVDDNKNVVSAFRTLVELNVLNSSNRVHWKRHIKENLSTIPRFYHSGFIWSIFYPHVADIKTAYARLGYYHGVIDNNPDAGFVLATMRFQQNYCEVNHLAKKKEKYEVCSDFPDGIVGKGTVWGIYRALIEKFGPGVGSEFLVALAPNSEPSKSTGPLIGLQKRSR